MSPSKFDKKITPDILETIIKLRREGLTLRKIGDKVGLSYETVRVHLNRSLPSADKYNLKQKTKKLAPIASHSTTVKYDFLKNMRVVFKHARVTYGLMGKYVEMLLWLYPRGPFSRSDFNEFHNTVEILPKSTLTMFIDKGFITEWRKAEKGRKAMFIITNKTKLMCGDMHNFLTGDKAIPTSPKRNGLAKEGAPRFHSYFMKAIKQINKDRG
jgi:hypothetical protein